MSRTPINNMVTPYLESLLQDLNHPELSVAAHIVVDILGIDLDVVTPGDQFHLLPTLSNRSLTTLEQNVENKNKHGLNYLRLKFDILSVFLVIILISKFGISFDRDLLLS